MKEVIDHSKIRIPSNFLLVKVDSQMEKYHINGEESNIFIGTSYEKYIDPEDSIDFSTQETVMNQADHWAVTGTVIQVPEKLVFYGDDINSIRNRSELDEIDLGQILRLSEATLRYESPQEVKKGDRLFFETHVHIQSLENSRILETDIGPLHLIKYDMARGIIKPDGIYPLNNIVFFKWHRKSKEIILDIHESHISDANPKEGLIGEVVENGINCKREVEDYHVHDLNIPELKKGTRFIFKGMDANNAENNGHYYLFGGEEIHMIRKSKIVAITE